MTTTASPEIVIEGAKTNNLKNVSLRIPHHKLIVVTGVSGSGKSSLVFDLIAQEAQRRYFETLPSFARQFMGKLNRPEVDRIEGLSPVIAIGQQTSGMHARSTVGTMSDIYDLLRLLFARTGQTDNDIILSRALFSFNSVVGKCSTCKGIGNQEEIDLNRLIADPGKTLREGALAPTLPTGYIMYSQVTMDVLNQVCEAEGFHVDIPWKELTAPQREVILYGSQKIKVPFGKHSLESRLKWTGIKAKPREEGYYKGMIPIMSDILRRDRNANIIKYVHAVTCDACKGSRLNADALSVTVQGKTIAELAAFEIGELKDWLTTHPWKTVAAQITQKLVAQVQILEDLGLGHLALDRSAKSLRASEIQRIRVANQILAPLSNVMYIFDEPSIGLHREENERMIRHFQQLVQKGNTVIIVEHDLQTISNADHIIEIGPSAGSKGGQVIFNGSFSQFTQSKELTPNSPTLRALTSSHESQRPSPELGKNTVHLFGCHTRNLKNIDVTFQTGKLNVVSGKSGTGKFSLIKDTLVKLVQQLLEPGSNKDPAKVSHTKNLESFKHLVYVRHTPIGKTPRSNPATYLGLSDHIRDLYASLPTSKEKGYTKSRFSFNTKGGRCETCIGAGKTQIGMHFLGNIDLVCSSCNGDRFNAATLTIRYQGLSIADCYKLSVNDALVIFKDHKKIQAGLQILQDIGLGYLTLGQSSTTLSGGEAQRIKIANQLQKKDTGNTLYVIIEPAIGLHQDDISSLIRLFNRIKKRGNTIVCIEQNESIIAASDWHLELGPKSGKLGGDLLYMGVPGNAEDQKLTPLYADLVSSGSYQEINLKGVSTNGLKNIDASLPKNQLTVVTGVSGSGKSSLVYDTLFAEANARFTESLSAYNRSFLQQNSQAKITSFSGLGPAIGINRKKGTPAKRSTVGTLSGVYDAFRLLYSRIAQHEGKPYTAQHFSFNHHLGACSQCEGLGTVLQCNTDELVVAPDQSIFEGAISTNKAIAYYADLHGQFMATLKEAAVQQGWNLERPWRDLALEEQEAILYGTGEATWEVSWQFKTKTKSGTQEITAKWLGFCRYIEEEYQRKLHNKNNQHLEALMHHVNCPSCHESRLKPELLTTRFLGRNIHEISQLSIMDCLDEISTELKHDDPMMEELAAVVLPGAISSLRTLNDLGLGHLNLNRPIRTLSGGERQRVTLAGQLATHLFGVTYVLDEPTIGLDGQQVLALSKVLKQIVANGNTVVVVEHDPDFIQSADYVIEMGPGAGNLGGEVIFQGKKSEILKAKNTATYELLQRSRVLKIKRNSRINHPFGIKGATSNNLKSIDVEFQSGQVTAITGVSGSGKSSLIKEILFASWTKQRSVHCSSVNGLDQFTEVVLIDQELQAQNRLSTPAMYLGVLNIIQGLYAQTESAKASGLKKADFSYQSKRGKCPTCAGHGQVKVSMDFMSDLWLTCDRCNGARYQDEILVITYAGLNMGAVLNLTVLEAQEYFQDRVISSHLQPLISLGIGHLRLGQPFNTLSGGEAQRLKLAKSLSMKRTGAVLYLFDEPSTGLHHSDLLQLLAVFQSIIDQGDTLIFIEHNHTLIQAANEVITLGPGSGEEGGRLISTKKNSE